MTSNEQFGPRDRALGSALTQVEYPPTRDGFWDDLERRLDTIDGVGVDTTDGRAGRHRLMLVTAAVLLAVIGAAVALRQLSSTGDTVKVEAVDDGIDTGVDDGPTTTDETSPSSDIAEDVDGEADGGAAPLFAGPIQYDVDPEILELPTGSVVWAGAADRDRLVLSTPVPGEEDFGCGQTGRLAMIGQTSGGDDVVQAPAEIADFDLVEVDPFNPNRFLARGTCREDITPYVLAEMDDVGTIEVQATLQEPWDEVEDLPTWGIPIWSNDEARLSFATATADGTDLRLDYDTATGDLLGSEVLSERLVVELTGGQYIHDQANDWFRAVPSIDGQLGAVIVGQSLEVFDQHAETVYSLTDRSAEFTDLAWTPTNVLIAVGGRGTIVAIEPMSGTVHYIQPAAASDAEWRSVVVADGGRIIAVSEEPGPEGRALALRFDP